MSTQEPPPSVDPVTEATLLVEELSAALVNVRIYAADHPRVVQSLAAVRKAVRTLADLLRAPCVRIACVEGLIVFGEEPLRGASMGATRLLTMMKNLGSSGIEFDADVTDETLQQLFGVLLERPRPGASWSDLNATLAARNCRSVRVLPPFVEGAGPCKVSGAVRLGLDIHQSVVGLLQNITISVCRGGHIDFAPVAAHAEQLLDRLARTDELQGTLARQEQYDAFTLGHSLRVAILALNFARTLTADRELLIRIGTAALLHDVGKSLIPFEILHSPAALSADERREMEKHAELGACCLLDHRDADPMAIAAAFGHHRGAKGGGYPDIAHEHATSLVTGIVKICDVFEALTAARPYKQPMSPIRAYRVMLAMGDKLDRRLLRRFIDENGIYPVGQLVELDTGQVAVVRDQGEEPLAPRLAVLDRPSDVDVTAEEEQVFVLGDIACCSARAILRELTPDEARARLREP